MARRFFWFSGDRHDRVIMKLFFSLIAPIFLCAGGCPAQPHVDGLTPQDRDLTAEMLFPGVDGPSGQAVTPMEDHYDLFDEHAQESLEHYADVVVCELGECTMPSGS